MAPAPNEDHAKIVMRLRIRRIALDQRSKFRLGL
jgi:hypothetical protein